MHTSFVKTLALAIAIAGTTGCMTLAERQEQERLLEREAEGNICGMLRNKPNTPRYGDVREWVAERDRLESIPLSELTTAQQNRIAELRANELAAQRHFAAVELYCE